MKKSCENCVYSDRPAYDWPCTACVTAYDNPPTKWKGIEEQKPKTNADRIRSMTDEELAEILIFWNDDWGHWETDGGIIDGYGDRHRGEAIKAELDWLKQPAEQRGTGI